MVEDCSRPNKFQSLLSAPHVRMYSHNERMKKAVVIKTSYLLGTLLPSLKTAAVEYVANRSRAVRDKVRKGITDITYPDEQTALITESLFDPHFRKQCRFGPSKQEVALKVTESLQAKKPIQLVGLMFTRKNICPLKRNGGDESIVDFAEILSFTHLNAFSALISEFHPYGVTYTVLSEGTRFMNAFQLCEPAVRLYQQRIHRWIEFLELDHMRLLDYEIFLSRHLSLEGQARRRSEYEKALELYQQLMLPIFDPCNMQQTLQQAIERDPVIDARNSRNNFVPLWDSIKNSLPYPELQKYARERGVEYDRLYRDFFADITARRTNNSEEKLRCQILETSWRAAMEHNARVMGDTKASLDVGALIDPHAFRTSINPKPGSHLGIYAMRETTSRVQPWHGTAFIGNDGVGRLTSTVLSKLEIESAYGIPVYVDKLNESTFCYVNDQIAELLRNEALPVFNVSTRV